MGILRILRSVFEPKPKKEQEPSSLVLIRGNFNGELNNGLQVLIESSGSLKGNITARSLEIYGEAEGNVAVENLLIRSSGRLHYADLSYDDLRVEDGGVMAPAEARPETTSR